MHGLRADHVQSVSVSKSLPVPSPRGGGGSSSWVIGQHSSDLIETFEEGRFGLYCVGSGNSCRGQLPICQPPRELNGARSMTVAGSTSIVVGSPVASSITEA